VNDEAPLPSDDHDTTLKPPQFTLRALMIGTAAVAILLSVLLAIGAFWAAALLFLLLLVAAHVLGNSVGTRLRDGKAGRMVMRPAGLGVARAATGTAVPAGRLSERKRLHWIYLVFTLCGAIAAGYFGGRALSETYPEATTAAVVLAHISSGVLGGFAVFVVTSFLEVLRQALSEAHAASDRHRPSSTRAANSEVHPPDPSPLDSTSGSPLKLFDRQ
jgi:hypothetical protein